MKLRALRWCPTLRPFVISQNIGDAFLLVWKFPASIDYTGGIFASESDKMEVQKVTRSDPSSQVDTTPLRRGHEYTAQTVQTCTLRGMPRALSTPSGRELLPNWEKGSASLCQTPRIWHVSAGCGPRASGVPSHPGGTEAQCQARPVLLPSRSPETLQGGPIRGGLLST